MSKFFKRLNKKTTKVPDPRSMPEIMAEYNQLKSQAGELQYQIFALTQNLADTNQKILAVNHEGAARQKADKESAAKPITKEAASE